MVRKSLKLLNVLKQVKLLFKLLLIMSDVLLNMKFCITDARIFLIVQSGLLTRDKAKN